MGFLDDKQKERITEFVKFVRKQLQLEKCPTIVLQNGRGELKTTANYDYSKENNKWIDAKPSYSTTKTEMLQYKYQLDVDGEVNAWSALWWKLYSNSVVFKVDSHYEQWYYKDLKEWVHYIPVKADLSDLEEKYKWALENDEKCREIALEGRNLAVSLTYENVIKNYKRKSTLNFVYF